MLETRLCRSDKSGEASDMTFTLHAARPAVVMVVDRLDEVR
jgi:hypothetical protein